jgi:hypothetical protein
MQNEIMHTSQLRCRYDSVAVRLTHAGDILTHGAIKQLNVLWHVTDISAAICCIPDKHVGTI